MSDVPFPDWSRLAPHRPLSPGDAAYVARPVTGGDAIAAWVVAGGGSVLVTGPTGVGKSTELARAAGVLRESRVACLLQVDRLANVHRLTNHGLMSLIAEQLVKLAREQLDMSLSQSLVAAVDRARRGTVAFIPEIGPSREAGAKVAREAILEIARLSRGGRVCLVVDGLEKLLPAAAPQIFAAFADLPDEAELVMTIPWHAAFSGGTESIVRSGEHLHRITALEVDGAAGLATSRFLASVVARRLVGSDVLPPDLDPLLGIAFQRSGGLPRVFLQLIADAGTYARVTRAAPWPDRSDLAQAIRDQEDSFRRALLPGDTAAIREIVGTDGRELGLERRVRLLAQGILLERVRDGTMRVEVHPLAAAAIQTPHP